MIDQPRRRRISFTLRSLLVCVALLAIGPGGWVAHHRHQSQRQLQVVTVLRDQIRHMELVSRFDDLTVATSAQASWRQLLRRALGQRVYSINFDFKQLDDLAPLAELTDLRLLSVNGTQVRDLAPLVGLKNLETLDLRATPVADLAPLAGLSKLQSLLINDTQCADLAPLVGLVNLQTLTLTQTQFHDLSPIAQLSNLRSLDLRAERFSREQLEMCESLSAALPNCKINQDLVYRGP